MRSFDEICSELRNHPDFLAACIWQRSDITMAMENLEWGGEINFTMNEADIWDKIDLSYWEDIACEDGFEAIYSEMSVMNAYEIKEAK